MAGPPDHPADPRRWRSIATIAASRTIDDTESGVMNSLFPVIRSALHLELAQLGVLVSIQRFARMVFGPIWSMAADRWGYKRVLIFITGIWGVWTGLAGLAQNFEQLLILYALGAIGTVAGEPISNGMIAKYFANRERGRAYGAVRSLTAFGSVLLTPCIGQFSRLEDGWRIGLYLMGFLSMLSGLAIAFWVDEVPEESSPSSHKPAGNSATEALLSVWQSTRKVLRIPTLWLLAGSTLFITSIVMIPFMVTFFVDVRGWTTADATLLQAVFQAGWMVSSVLGGWLGDWFERILGPRGRIVLMQIYLFCFSAITALTFQFDWGRGFTAYLMVFLTGLIGAMGFSGVVMPMVSHVTPARSRATAFALLFSFFQGLFAAIISLLSAKWADTVGLQAIMWWAVSVPYAVNGFYWTIFYHTYPRDRMALDSVSDT